MPREEISGEKGEDQVRLVAAPALGDLSDRWGRRPVLVFSLVGTVVSFVMLALAQSVVMLFLARIVDGLSGGNISTARAYVADVTEPKDRARAYGLIGDLKVVRR